MARARGETGVKVPKFTDQFRFQRPYSDAAASEKEGYLRAKFARIRKDQAEDAEKKRLADAESAAKVRKIKEAK